MALTKITPQMFDTSAAGHDFNIDNGTFVVDASANRVGIGTATPSTLLDVNGTATATTFVGALTGNVTGNVSGTAATVTGAAQTNITSLGTLTGLTSSGQIKSQSDFVLADSGGTNRGFVFGTASGVFARFNSGLTFQVQEAGSTKFTIASGGNATFTNNVTVNGTIAGTLTTAAQTNITSLGTLTALTVSGDLTIADKIIHSGDTDTFIRFAGPNDVRVFAGNVEHAAFDGTIVLNQSGADMDFRVESTGNQNMLFVDAGNDRVGIGTNSPTEAFTIKGDGYRMTVESDDHEVAMLGRRGSSGTALDSGYLRLRDQGVTANGVVLDTNGSSWLNGGNVGIGTTSPESGLHLYDGTNVRAPQNANRKATLVIEAGSEGSADIQLLNNSYSHIFFGDSADPNTGLIWYQHASGGTGADSLHFGTAGDAERVNIDSSGNVGIGVTNPAQALDVSGTIQSTVGLRVAGHPVVGYSSITGGYAANLGSTGSSTLNETHFYAGGTKRIAMNSTGTVFGDVSQTADGMTATPNDINQAEMGPGYLRLKRDDTASAQQLTFDKNGSTHSYFETSTTGLEYVATGSGIHRFHNNIVTNGADIKTGKDFHLNESSANAHRYMFLNRTVNHDGQLIFRQSGTNQWQASTNSGHDLNFYSYQNGSRMQVRFFSGGDVQIDDGNLIVASGHGIDFSAKTPNASDSSITSELLDDYEEGVYTVTVTSQNGTMALQSGYDTLSYTKIGRQVTINGRIRFGTISGASGFVKLSVPFTNLNIGGQGDYAYFSTAGHNVNVSADIYGVFGEMGPNVSQVIMLQKFDNAGWNYWDASNYSAGDYLYLAGTYFTAS